MPTVTDRETFFCFWISYLACCVSVCDLVGCWLLCGLGLHRVTLLQSLVFLPVLLQLSPQGHVRFILISSLPNGQLAFLLLFFPVLRVHRHKRVRELAHFFASAGTTFCKPGDSSFGVHFPVELDGFHGFTQLLLLLLLLLPHSDNLLLPLLLLLLQLLLLQLPLHLCLIYRIVSVAGERLLVAGAEVGTDFLDDLEFLDELCLRLLQGLAEELLVLLGEFSHCPISKERTFMKVKNTR